MRLNEFQSPSIKVGDLIRALQSKFRLEQNGGSKRVYTVGKSGELGVVFAVNQSTRAIGLTWARGTKVAKTVYIWNVLDVDRSPDFAIDLPVDADLDATVDQLEKFIRSPRIGVLESALREATTPEPAAPPQAQNDDDDQIERVKQLAKRGQVILMARRANGTFFQIPGLDQILARLEHEVRTEEKAEDFDDAHGTMEEQYADMEEKVRMVVSGSTRHGKALIITGAPSSGKTFRVMRVLKELGLSPVDDYVKKTGKITAAALYRVMIEQLDGLIVFDDCDSVWSDENAVNMMKGALNTEPVREVSNDSKYTINTGAMKPEKRRVFVDAMSRILRGEPLLGDLEMFSHQIKGGLLSDKDETEEAYETDIQTVQSIIMRRLPNLIDYTGRMIFISNLDADQLDSAMLSRSFHIHMDFGDEDMLDFIEKIADKIEDSGSSIIGDPLTDDQRAEVIDFIRTRMRSPGFKSRVNFRFVQKAFDYRRSLSAWKRNVAAM